MKAIASGKLIVLQILAAKKEATNDELERPELQNLCDQLNAIVAETYPIINDLDELHEKLQSVHDLRNLSLSSEQSFEKSISIGANLEQVVQAHGTLCDQIKSQHKVVIDVAQNLGIAKTTKHAVFLASLWTMQPHLNDAYFISLEYLKTLKDG